MKVLSFGGGLGNQIFEYAFCCYMQNKYPDHRVYGHYNKGKLSEHYGLEIDKWFDVQIPKSTWFSTMTVGLFYILRKLIGEHHWIDTATRECRNEKAVVFVAYKYTKKYIPEPAWLRWKVDEQALSEQNKGILKLINQNNTWFIHVRRGDFLSPKYKETFEGCCPLEYYQKAIEDVKAKENDPHFICFSDDIAWAKENLPNVVEKFVDWNTGTDSPLDMYLMSQCNGAIIANSTFSYWGALLGKQKTRVYYPKKWINSKRGMPDIFFDSWISF